ncbi:hypothetical protein GXM_00538 [Nostoc sphaeroides CCNUC1]|uniref:Uncharacterized protein n=1 Tax=Nostoc sphaeroides CCNUC1 TaxID=2653204 RepID=A0A5P8VRM7_9NOSO|nr:hypothetical protein GXM_00538 [Nostoc sphaeroides CCNUC1]
MWGVGSREWGMREQGEQGGQGDLSENLQRVFLLVPKSSSLFPIPHSPLPTPYSPFPIF